jgi:hypothetical protein
VLVDGGPEIGQDNVNLLGGGCDRQRAEVANSLFCMAGHRP